MTTVAGDGAFGFAPGPALSASLGDPAGLVVLPDGQILTVDRAQARLLSLSAGPTRCLDGDPCTDESCDAVTGQCTPAPLGDGAPCDDADACTQGDQCLAGACQGAPAGPECDDDTPCTSDYCDPVGGVCVSLEDLDGEPCGGDGMVCVGTSCECPRYELELPRDNSENLHDVAVAPDGFATAVGTIWSDDKGFNGYAVRVDPVGAIVWQETLFAGPYEDVLVAAEPAPDGTVWAAGRRGWSATTERGWLVRIDPSGALLMNKAISNPASKFELRSLTLDGAGGVVVVGKQTAWPLGSYILHYDEGGALQWWDERTADGDVVVFEDVARLPDGTYAVVGWIEHEGYVAQYTADGALLFEKTLTKAGSGDHELHAVVPNGAMIRAVGKVSGGGSADAWHVVVTAGDFGGGVGTNELWGGSGIQNLTALELLGDTLVAAGRAETSFGSGGLDGWLRDFGPPAEAHYYGGSGDDTFTGLSLHASGAMTMVGKIDSSQKLWLLRVGPEGGTSCPRVGGGTGSATRCATWSAAPRAPGRTAACRRSPGRPAHAR